MTLEQLAERFTEVERERDQHLDDLKRLAAEFDNYRKRMTRDQQGLVARANERLVKELLPVLDDLERALEAAAEHEEAAQRPVRDSGPGEGVRGNREVPPVRGDVAGAHEVFEGVRLVHRNLDELLKREGLAEIETEGRFDPHVHEALLAQPSEQEEGSVIDVVQKGYRLGDHVVRPARVVIASAETTQAPVRDSGPAEGARGNQEVLSADDEVRSDGNAG